MGSIRACGAFLSPLRSLTLADSGDDEQASRDPPQVRHSIGGLNREHSWANETKITEESSEVREATSFGRSSYSEDPSFDLRDGTFGRRQVGLEERGEATILVGTREPSANAVSVVLVARPTRAGEATAP